MNEGLNQFHAAQVDTNYKVPRNLEQLKREVNRGYELVARKYGWADVSIRDVANLEVTKARAAKKQKSKPIKL